MIWISRIATLSFAAVLLAPGLGYDVPGRMGNGATELSHAPRAMDASWRRRRGGPRW